MPELKKVLKQSPTDYVTELSLRRNRFVTNVR